jgi:hypothetical protein
VNSGLKEKRKEKRKKKRDEPALPRVLSTGSFVVE